LVEFGDSFVDGKLNTIFAVILVDFDAAFVAQIIALKVLPFREVGIVIVPGLYNLI
jgi:hypothetical protein